MTTPIAEGQALERARAALKNGDAKAALRALDGRTDAASDIVRVKAHTSLGQFLLAGEAAHRAVRHGAGTPGEARANIALLTTLIDQFRNAEAEAVARRVLTRSPPLWERAEAERLLAEIARRRGDRSECTRRFDLAEAAARKCGDELLLAGLLRHRLWTHIYGGHSVPEELVTRAGALLRKPGFERWCVYVERAETSRCIRSGDFEGALAAERRAFQLAWDHGTPWGRSVAQKNLGDTLRVVGRPGEAITHTRKSLDLLTPDASGQRATTLVKLALCHVATQDVDEAVRLYDESVTLVPDGSVRNVVARLLRAPLANRDGHDLPPQIDAWLAALERHQHADGDTAEATIRLAAQAAKRGHLAKSAEWFDHGMGVAHAAGRPDVIERARSTCRELRDAGAPVCLGSYELVDRIGQGGMGEVWRARKGTDAFAIKLVTTELARTEAAADAFREEVRATMAMRHEFAVPVFDFGFVGPGAAALSGGRLHHGSPYLVMPIAQGNLTEQCGRQPWESVERIALGLLDALSATHARGLTHMDVKPENVLVHPDGFWLADFGLATAVGDTTSGASGTPTYMAPERWIHSSSAALPASDLYALGCLVWELVCGRPPFEGETAAELYLAHHRDPPGPLCSAIDVPAGLQSWLERLLAKHPGDRFASAAAAALALRSLGPPQRNADRRPLLRELERRATTFFMGVDFEPTELGPGPPPLSWPTVTLAADWRTVTEADCHGHALAAGLFEVSEPPLFGREAEMSALWSELRAVASDRRNRTVRIEGLPGSGAHQLARWLQQTAARTGAVAAGLVGVDVDALPREGPSTAPRGLPTLTVEVVRPDDPELTQAAKVDLHVSLGRITNEALVNVVLCMLPLTLEATRRLVERCHGVPGFAVQVLGDWVQRDHLVPGTKGLELRTNDPTPLPLASADPWKSYLLVDERSAVEILAAGSHCVTVRSFAAALEHAGVPWPETLLEDWVTRGLLEHSEESLRWLAPALRELILSAMPDPAAVHLHWAAVLSDDDPVAAVEHRAAAGLDLDLTEIVRLGWDEYEVGGDRTRALFQIWDRAIRATASGDQHPSWAGGRLLGRTFTGLPETEVLDQTLRRGTPQDRTWARILLGERQFREGNLAEGQRLFREVIAEAQSPRIVVRAARGLVRAHVRRGLPCEEEEALLQRLRTDLDPSVRVQAHRGLAAAASKRADPVASKTYLEAALADSQSKEERAHTLHLLAAIVFHTTVPAEVDALMALMGDLEMRDWLRVAHAEFRLRIGRPVHRLEILGLLSPRLTPELMLNVEILLLAFDTPRSNQLRRAIERSRSDPGLFDALSLVRRLRAARGASVAVIDDAEAALRSRGADPIR